MDLAIVTENLLVGTQVRSDEDIGLLQRLGVKGLLNLQDDKDLEAAGLRWDILWRIGMQAGIDMRRHPIRDFSPGDLLEKLPTILYELHQLLEEHDRVYVHCTAGINRSAGIVLSYLVLRRGMSLDAAYRLLKSRRPQASPYQALLSYLATPQRNGKSA